MHCFFIFNWPFLVPKSSGFCPFFRQNRCTQRCRLSVMFWCVAAYVCTRFLPVFTAGWFYFQNIAVWERQQKSECKRKAHNVLQSVICAKPLSEGLCTCNHVRASIVFGLLYLSVQVICCSVNLYVFVCFLLIFWLLSCIYSIIFLSLEKTSGYLFIFYYISLFCWF